MNPGATISPVTSITRAPGPARNDPTATTRSPLIATSAGRRGAPVPSTRVPPLSTTSASTVTVASSARATASAAAKTPRANVARRTRRIPLLTPKPPTVATSDGPRRGLRLYPRRAPGASPSDGRRVGLRLGRLVAVNRVGAAAAAEAVAEGQAGGEQHEVAERAPGGGDAHHRP